MLAISCAPRYTYQYGTCGKVKVKDQWTKADHAYMTLMIFLTTTLVIELNK